MGRPLKITKAHAVFNITATTVTTNIITTNANFTTLGIIPGMTFVTATSVGGLTAGTTYWILAVVNSGANSTFTASATPLNANPRFTPVTLSTTTAQTISTTVGLVDSGFQNPDSAAQSGGTSTNPDATYGALGGDTRIYGKQAVANVAIGRVGTGTLFSDPVANNSVSVYGLGTNLSTTLSAGSAIQVAVGNINGRTDYVDIGFASATIGTVTVACANTTAGTNIIGTTGNAQTLSIGKPVTFSANSGGLLINTVYYVKTIANAAAFTVSLQQGGVDVTLTTAAVATNAVQDRVNLTANTMVVFNNANFIYSNAEAGYIVRQKGKSKYLVTGITSNLTAQCNTANVANTALTPNTMSVIGTYANAATAYVRSLNDYNSELFYATTAASALVQGSTYTIVNVGDTNWTLVGASDNFSGISFTATGAGSGTGTAILSSDSADFYSTFGTAYAANTYASQPYPIITVNNT